MKKKECLLLVIAIMEFALLVYMFVMCVASLLCERLILAYYKYRKQIVISYHMIKFALLFKSFFPEAIKGIVVQIEEIMSLIDFLQVLAM